MSMPQTERRPSLGTASRDGEEWTHRLMANGSIVSEPPAHEAHGRCGSCGNAVHRFPFGWQHVGAGMYSCAFIDPQASCCDEHAAQNRRHS